MMDLILLRIHQNEFLLVALLLSLLLDFWP